MSEPEAGKSTLPQHQTPIPQVSIEEFRKIDLRIGVVVAAEDHPNADRLLVLNVDLGDGTPRRLVAGIKGAYQASELIGKRVVVVANLKPAMLRGIESQGMVLAAQDGTQLAFLTPERPIQPGGTVR
ncbi:MAG: methionine--tRNA ligase subunit beta [Candidatus Omnitrophica bacterium]|nr:methionine--tRNA ligase subunit beta [Candidatus Omnitrophota bacterium]